MTTPRIDRRACSIHEAGHAAVALALGFCVREIRIADGHCDDSVTWMRAPSYPDPLLYAVDYATILAAGVLAEVIDKRANLPPLGHSTTKRKAGR